MKNANQDRFSTLLPYILASEGGNDDNPHDPGGRTSRGVIQREYDVYRKIHGLPPGDVWKASDAEIADIYRSKYWEPYGDKLPPGLDYLFFDMAVNMGPVQAAKLLQRGLGVTPDGHIGPITLNAVANSKVIPTIVKVSDEKRAFYRSLNAYKYFGKGWMNRTARVENDALKMAVSEGK